MTTHYQRGDIVTVRHHVLDPYTGFRSVERTVTVASVDGNTGTVFLQEGSHADIRWCSRVVDQIEPATAQEVAA